MRVLRSQLMQLQNNDCSRTATHLVSAYRQQQQVPFRPTLHNKNSTPRNSRRIKFQGAHCSCDNSPGNNTNAISLQQDMSQKSTLTTTSSPLGLRSLNMATVDYPQTPCPFRSSTTSSTSTCSSGYVTLNQSDQTTLNNDHTTQVDATEQQNLDQTSNDLIEQTTTTHEQYHHMHIKFSNVAETVGNINVSVEFTDMSAQWLTRIYRTYEGDLWNRVPRIPPKRHSKWLFSCTFCHKQLCHFDSLKSHLNRHLELYPYVCKFCARPYAGRQALTKHLQSKHDVKSEYGNYIGI